MQRALCPATGSRSAGVASRNARGERAARREPAARSAGSRAWAPCPGSARPHLASAAVSSRGIEPSRPCVYGWCGLANSSLDARLLDDLARVHHDDPCADLGDHAEVVRDQHASPCRVVLQPAISSRICAWIVTSSAVVGSSAISSSGRRRAPSRSSRAGACRPRTGADSRRAAAAARDADQLAASRSRVLRRLGAPSAWCSRSGFADLLADRVDRVERGHRLLEDHRDLIAADVAHLVAASSRRGRVPSTAPSRPRSGPAAPGPAQHDQRRDALAVARLADHARGSRRPRPRRRRRPPPGPHPPSV